MNDWVAMTINVSYMVLAYLILKASKPKFLDGAHVSLIAAELFLAAVFVQIGLILFNIPIGFFGLTTLSVSLR
ncbi:MAG: hypothetical protein ACPG3X_06300 [Opitutales bacterium]